MLINRLPEKLMLRIFSYLSHTELCVIARVSKQWRRWAYDPSLWYSLNLRTDYGGIYVRSIEDLLNLLRHRSGASLRHIELGSDLITVPVLELLGNECPDLRSLTLDFSNAMQLHDFNELAAFPSSLSYLCICLSDVIFMEGLMRKIYSCLSSVEILHLVGTFEQASEEEEEIYEVINISKIKAHAPNLRVVNLYGIAFIDDSHVELLAMNCIHLECVALNFCLNVKGSSFTLLISNCTKVKSLLLEHCGLKDEYMIAAPWEKSHICELDLTSTELSGECLENFLMRLPYLTHFAVGHSDFFSDKILTNMMEAGKFSQIKAVDFSFTPALTEHAILPFLRQHGPTLEGLMMHGKPPLAEYFWATVIPFLKSIRICVLGSPHGWFFKYNTRVHIDKILEKFAASCPNLEALEIQWDPDTIRFSDKSRKFIDRIRLKCTHLKSLTLSDGKYYEMVKGNFERADCFRVVRTCTAYITSIEMAISTPALKLRRKLDKYEDSSGGIPLTELKGRLEKSSLPGERINRFVKMADTNRDGKISYPEFVDQFLAEDENITNKLRIQKRVLNKAVLAIAPVAGRKYQHSTLNREAGRGTPVAPVSAPPVLFATPSFAYPPSGDATDYNWGQTEDIDNYIEAYDCHPPPLFIPLVSLVQIAMFIYYCVVMYMQRKQSLSAVIYSGAPIDSPLVYDPYRRSQIWRFLSYMLIHQGLMHLAFNCLLQLALGTILELVHKFWRVGLVYLLGVIAGSLAHSVTDPFIALVGASGGCYALIGAHLASVVINWEVMQKNWLDSPHKLLSSGVVRLLLIIVLGGGDTALAIYSRYTNPEQHRIGFAAHFGGFLSGILLGIPILRNLKIQRWEKICFWICIVLYLLFASIAIIFNFVCIPYDLCPKVNR